MARAPGRCARFCGACSGGGLGGFSLVFRNSDQREPRAAGRAGGAAASVTGAASFNATQWGRVALGLVLTTLPAFILGRAVFALITLACRRRNRREVTPLFVAAQRFGAAAGAYLHGLQDGQKFMGAVMICVRLAGGAWEGERIPIRVAFFCAAFMAAGTALGGSRIIKRVALDMVRLDAPRGFAADLSAVLCLAACTALGLPVSTTHAKTCAVMGREALNTAGAGITLGARHRYGMAAYLPGLLCPWLGRGRNFGRYRRFELRGAEYFELLEALGRLVRSSVELVCRPAVIRPKRGCGAKISRCGRQIWRGGRPAGRSNYAGAGSGFYTPLEREIFRRWCSRCAARCSRPVQSTRGRREYRREVAEACLRLAALVEKYTGMLRKLNKKGPLPLPAAYFEAARISKTPPGLLAGGALSRLYESLCDACEAVIHAVMGNI